MKGGVIEKRLTATGLGIATEQHVVQIELVNLKVNFPSIYIDFVSPADSFYNSQQCVYKCFTDFFVPLLPFNSRHINVATQV